MATTNRKSATKTSSGRLNKSAWIRSQTASLSAKEVVDRAKAEGIALSLAQVYTARSTAKRLPVAAKRADVTTKAGVKVSSALRASKLVGGDSLRREFVALAMRIGTDEAQGLLKRIAASDTTERLVR